MFLLFCTIILFSSSITVTASCESDLSEVNTTKIYRTYLKLNLYSFLQNPINSDNILSFSELNQSLRFYIQNPTIDESIICDQGSTANIAIMGGINITDVVFKMVLNSPRNVIPRCIYGPAAGTQFGECSSENKPYFCFMGESVQRCSGVDKILGNEDDCGCANESLICNEYTGKCGASCVDICEDQYAYFCSIDDKLMKKVHYYDCDDGVCSESHTLDYVEQDCILLGKTCLNNECNGCLIDSDCTTGQYCVNKYCIDCRNENDCYSYPINEYQCSLDQNSLESKYNQVKCINPGETDAYCDSLQTYEIWKQEEDCTLNNQICLDEQCRGCTIDSDCNMDETCYNDFCVRCISDSDCSNHITGDYRCTGNIVETKLVQEKCFESGTYNSYCDSLQTYEIWKQEEDCTLNNQVCLDEQCRGCTIDSDCNMDETCYNDFCVRCISDSDCSNYLTNDYRCTGNIIETKLAQEKCSESGTYNSYCDSENLDEIWQYSSECTTEELCLFNNDTMTSPICFTKPLLKLNFEDGFSSTTFEDSANDNDFMCNSINCPEWSANQGFKNSGAYKFGSKTEPTFIFKNLLDYGNKFTISFLFKPLNHDYYEGYLLDHGNNLEPGKNTIKIKYSNISGMEEINTFLKDDKGKPLTDIISPLTESGSLYNNGYQRYTIVVKPNNIKIYINGINNPVETIKGGSQFYPDLPFYIGNDYYGQSYTNFHGYIDEFAIWNIALTEAELIQLDEYYNYNIPQ